MPQNVEGEKEEEEEEQAKLAASSGLASAAAALPGFRDPRFTTPCLYLHHD